MPQLPVGIKPQLKAHASSSEAVHAFLPDPDACGVPKLGHTSWPGLLRGTLVFVDEAAEDGPTLDPLPGEVGGGMAGAGRAELAAAVGSPSVVVGLILGKDQPQVSFAEDQYPVGDLRPGGEHEPFGVGVRAWASGRELVPLEYRVGPLTCGFCCGVVVEAGSLAGWCL